MEQHPQSIPYWQTAIVTTKTRTIRSTSNLYVYSHFDGHDLLSVDAFRQVYSICGTFSRLKRHNRLAVIS